MFTPTEIQKVVDSINFHYSMLIVTNLGVDTLDEGDVSFLKTHGVDIEAVKQQFSPYMQMFMLGRLTTVLKESQLRGLNFEDFTKYISRGQFVPLSQRERAEFEYSRQKTYNHLKGLGGKITGAAKDLLLEENKKQIIHSEIEQAIKDRKSIQSVISEIGHKTGEWERDWKRIVVTEMQDIYNQGRASQIMDKYGEEALVWKHVYPTACRHCIRLFLTNGIGSKPIVFKLTKLIENGTNIGRKVDDWKPVLGPVHPHCRCDVNSFFRGQEWDSETNQFKYTGEQQGKVKSTSKVKVTIGDKIFEV